MISEYLVALLYKEDDKYNLINLLLNFRVITFMFQRLYIVILAIKLTRDANG